MAKKQKLEKSVFLYIEAKKRLTSCMQEHFKQVCHTCKKYAKCSIYNEYVQAWMDLQNSYENQSNKSNPKKSKKKVKSFGWNHPAYELSEYFLASLLAVISDWQPSVVDNPDKLEELLQKWTKSFDGILNKDNRNLEEVKQLILFVHNSEFSYKAKFSAQRFRQDYESIRDSMRRYRNGKEVIIKDPNSDLTNKLISSLQKWGLVPKGITHSPKQIGQLRLTIQRMMEFYKSRTCQDDEIWFEDLYDCLNQNYLGKGATVSIGLLCSDYLWDILMTQLLRTCASE